jgi:hypothetical protein
VLLFAEYVLILEEVIETGSLIPYDSAKIPYFAVLPKTLKANGTCPTLLYGYGGFEISELPWYSAVIGSSWLEKGGAFILANIRGALATVEFRSTDVLLARIAAALERLAVNTPAPNYKRGLAAFKGFDFARLGIRVVKSDGDGPSVLEWNNHYFTRRSGKGKFGVAVWFSRPIGKGESDDEELRFERLITFKDYSEAESLPAEARKGATP